MSTKFFAAMVMMFATLTGCASGGSGNLRGNDGGSAPISESESREYKAQLLKCYKTGGTRVVKIEGTLRCY